MLYCRSTNMLCWQVRGKSAILVHVSFSINMAGRVLINDRREQEQISYAIWPYFLILFPRAGLQLLIYMLASKA